MTSDPFMRERRNRARLALRASAARRVELLALREKNIHAVDYHALNDISLNDTANGLVAAHAL
jgi:hypothetical protein